MKTRLCLASLMFLSIICLPAQAAPDQDVQELIKKGWEYKKKKQFKTAAFNFNEALVKDPNNKEAQNALVSVWEALLAKNPLSADFHIGLGIALRQRGDIEQARTEFEQAIRFSPGRENTKAREFLDRLDVESQLNQSSTKSKAMNNAQAWVKVGKSYQAKKQFSHALEAYKGALCIDPDNKPALDGVKACKEALDKSKRK